MKYSNKKPIWKKRVHIYSSICFLDNNTALVYFFTETIRGSCRILLTNAKNNTFYMRSFIM